MILEEICKENKLTAPLYDKELLRGGYLRDSTVDTALNHNRHKRFLSMHDHPSEGKEYENAVFDAFQETLDELTKARERVQEVNGMMLIFNYLPNKAFERLHIKRYPIGDKPEFQGKANMFSHDGSFGRLMAEIAKSEDYHDGAVLIGADGENNRVSVYIDIWLHAVTDAYGQPYSSIDKPCLVKRAGLRNDAKTRQLTSIMTSLIMADVLVGMIRSNLKEAYVQEWIYLLA